MKAIILAAGQSKRLYPLTRETPKCLLIVGSQTIINHQISILEKKRFKQIIVVTGFQAEKLEFYLKSHWPQLLFIFVRNNDYETTGAAYSLWLARDYFADDLLYLNSDLICDPTIIHEIIDHPVTSVTAIQKVEWNEEAVNVILNRNIVTEIGKHISKTNSGGEFIGATKLNFIFLKSLKEKLDEFVHAGELNKFAVDAINAVIKSGYEKMYALDISPRKAIEIDTPEDYKEAKKIMDENNETV